MPEKQRPILSYEGDTRADPLWSGKGAQERCEGLGWAARAPLRLYAFTLVSYTGLFFCSLSRSLYFYFLGGGGLNLYSFF